MHFTCKIQTPLGEMLAASDGSALTGLWFEGQKHFAAGLNLPGEAKKLPLFDEVKRQLEDYFNGSLRRFSVALRPHGTPFCQSVWPQSDFDYHSLPPCCRSRRQTHRLRRRS